MLLNNFFEIDNLEILPTGLLVDIRIHTDHEILKAHFPEQGIVPGVCMLEMLKEILQSHFNKSLMMESASVVKFLNMFTTPQLDKATFAIQINHNDTYDIDATLKNDTQVFLKFRGVFVELG
jgi:3-hydroxyacyl-[acyl-carrier-protein] dehydratase